MSIGLQAWEIHQARETSDAYLPGTAIISEPTQTSDGQGGQTWTYAPSGTVAARLAAENVQPSSGELAGRVANVTSWILTLPAATVITSKARVAFNSETYEVLAVLDRTPEEIARRVRLGRIK